MDSVIVFVIIQVLMGSMKMSALHLAAQDGNTESVQYLVQGGAKVGELYIWLYSSYLRYSLTLHLAFKILAMLEAKLLCTWLPWLNRQKRWRCC